MVSSPSLTQRISGSVKPPASQLSPNCACHKAAIDGDQRRVAEEKREEGRNQQQYARRGGPVDEVQAAARTR